MSYRTGLKPGGIDSSEYILGLLKCSKIPSQYNFLQLWETAEHCVQTLLARAKVFSPTLSLGGLGQVALNAANPTKAELYPINYIPGQRKV